MKRTESPLDPSKVKEGDTVTLERNKASVTDTVSATDHSDMGGVGPLIRLYETGGWFRLTDVDAWALTDHRAAPEPGPKWTPGTVVQGDVRIVGMGGDIDRELVRLWYVDEGDEPPYFVDDTGIKHRPSYVTDVRPLVVIDPAAVDVEALIADAIKSAQVKGYWPDRVVGGHMIRHALAHLGIEAIS